MIIKALSKLLPTKKKAPDQFCPGCWKVVTRTQTVCRTKQGTTWHLICHQQQCDAEGMTPTQYELFGIGK